MYIEAIEKDNDKDILTILKDRFEFELSNDWKISDLKISRLNTQIISMFNATWIPNELIQDI